MTIDSSSFIQAIILALFVTALAIIFGYFAKKASKHHITGKEILWTLSFTFMILGGLSAYLPIFMGNGQVLAQWIFSGNSSAYLPVILIIKCLLVCLLLRSGAYGGTLMPSFAIGVGTGYLITVLLGNFGFSHSLSLGMLLGATVFLGTMLDPPLTGFSSMDFFWELFSISSCHSHHQMSISLSTFKEWCLWWNSDAIVCYRCRYGLSDNGASWKFWIFS